MSDNPPKITISDAPKSDRKPRFETKARTPKPTVSASNAEVKKALATLDSAYNLVATGLMIAGLEDSANEWVTSAEQLRLTNEDALKASPRLAKAIASAGSTGGATTFLLTHTLAIAGIMKTVTKEVAQRRADNAETTDVGLS